MPAFQVLAFPVFQVLAFPALQAWRLYTKSFFMRHMCYQSYASFAQRYGMSWPSKGPTGPT